MCFGGRHSVEDSAKMDMASDIYMLKLHPQASGKTPFNCPIFVISLLMNSLNSTCILAHMPHVFTYEHRRRCTNCNRMIIIYLNYFVLAFVVQRAVRIFIYTALFAEWKMEMRMRMETEMRIMNICQRPN